MSKIIKEEFICSKCGTRYDKDTYLSINATLDPELKEKVLKGDICVTKCPVCGNEDYDITPVLYNDMDKKTYIMANSVDSILTNKKELSKAIKDFGEIMKGYKYIGVNTPADLRTCVIALDANLDPRIVMMMLMTEKESYIADNNLKDVEESKRVDNIYLDKDENGLQIVLTMKNGEMLYKPLEKEVYDALAKMFEERFDEIGASVFDFDACIKYVNELEEKYDENNTVELAMCVDNLGAANLFAVNDLIKKELRTGDFVAVIDDGNNQIFKFEKLLTYNKLELPAIVENFIKIDHIVEQKEVSDIKVAEKEIDNTELLETIKENKRLLTDFGSNNKLYTLLPNLKFVVAIEAIPNIAFKRQDATAGTFITNRKYKRILKKGREYLCVYTTPSRCETKDVIKCEVTFDDIVKNVTNNGFVAGIIINPGNEEIILPLVFCINYRAFKSMVTTEEMLKLLPSFNEEEQKYIGIENLNYIKEIYSDEHENQYEFVQKKYGLTEEEIGKKLDEGYKHIIDICLFRFYR